MEEALNLIGYLNLQELNKLKAEIAKRIALLEERARLAKLLKTK